MYIEEEKENGSMMLPRRLHHHDKFENSSCPTHRVGAYFPMPMALLFAPSNAVHTASVMVVVLGAGKSIAIAYPFRAPAHPSIHIHIDMCFKLHTHRVYITIMRTFRVFGTDQNNATDMRGIKSAAVAKSHH